MARTGSEDGNVLEGVGEWAAKLCAGAQESIRKAREKEPAANRFMSGPEHTTLSTQNTLRILMPCAWENGVQPLGLPLLFKLEPRCSEASETTFVAQS